MRLSSSSDRTSLTTTQLRLACRSAPQSRPLPVPNQVLAVYNDRLAEADFVMLAASGTRSARPRCSCFRARLRGHRARISCPNYQPLKRSTLHALKTRGNALQTGGNPAQTDEKARKTVDWSITLASISPSPRPCAYAGACDQKLEFRGRARVASAAVLRRPVPEILTPHPQTCGRARVTAPRSSLGKS